VLRQSMGYWFRTAAENLYRFDRMCCELKVSELLLSEDLILRWTAPREGEALQTWDVRIPSLKASVPVAFYKPSRDTVYSRWHCLHSFKICEAGSKRQSSAWTCRPFTSRFSHSKAIKPSKVAAF